MGKKVIPGRRKKYNLLFMTLPFMIIVLLFNYVPIFGWIYSVFDYIPGVSVFDCDFVGLDYFRLIFKDANVVRTLKNTFIFAVIGIVLTPLPMFFAILLNEIKCGPVRRVVQTFTTLPNFISWVIIFSLAFSLFATDGVVTTLIARITGSEVNSILSSGESVYWFQTVLGIWKSLGWSSIIYLAALSGVDQELHEAAMVDGASKLKRIIHIDLPAIIPTMVILLIMNAGSIMSVGYEKVYLMQNDLNVTTAEVISTYVYKIGLKQQQYSYSAAIGLFNNLINFILLVVVNKLSKKLSGSSLW